LEAQSSPPEPHAGVMLVNSRRRADPSRSAHEKATLTSATRCGARAAMTSELRPQRSPDALGDPLGAFRRRMDAIALIELGARRDGLQGKRDQDDPLALRHARKNGRVVAGVLLPEIGERLQLPQQD